MSKKRISGNMEKILNEQMTREAYQAQVYISYASWAEVNSFIGTADFLFKHAHEEREHMFKFLKYINDRGGETKIEAIKAPSANPKNMSDCLNKILQHEIDNSKQIDKIVDLAYKEKDWATLSFANWFVKEQIEEETLIKNIIDKYTLASQKIDNNVNLYELDKNLAQASQEATVPRDEKI